MTFQSKPSSDLRIASFLPAATEMTYALGLGDRLVAVTHECDYPPQARSKPIVVRPSLDFTTLGLSQIDKAVSERARSSQSLYALDETLLRKLSPTLILAQDLCQVCAPSGNEASRLLKTLDPKPEILYQTPRCFEDVLGTLLTLGDRTGTKEKAEEMVHQAREKLERVVSLSRGLAPVKVFFMEWVEPTYCGGHWIPEMLGWAGGLDPLARSGADSVRVPWEEVLRIDPEVLIVSPCGFGAKEAAEQAKTMGTRPGWGDLAAVRKGKVYAVDGNSYFARPSLRLVDGVELLAHLFHPGTFPWKGPAGAYERIGSL